MTLSQQTDTRRLTATPGGHKEVTRGIVKYHGGVTVWVERVDGAARVRMRPCKPQVNEDAYDQSGWTVLSQDDWIKVRNCVDRYFEAL